MPGDRIIQRCEGSESVEPDHIVLSQETQPHCLFTGNLVQLFPHRRPDPIVSMLETQTHCLLWSHSLGYIRKADQTHRYKIQNLKLLVSGVLEERAEKRSLFRACSYSVPRWRTNRPSTRRYYCVRGLETWVSSVGIVFPFCHAGSPHGIFSHRQLWRTETVALAYWCCPSLGTSTMPLPFPHLPCNARWLFSGEEESHKAIIGRRRRQILPFSPLFLLSSWAVHPTSSVREALPHWERRAGKAFRVCVWGECKVGAHPLKIYWFLGYHCIFCTHFSRISCGFQIILYFQLHSCSHYRFGGYKCWMTREAEEGGRGRRIPFCLEEKILKCHPAQHLRSVHQCGRGWLNYLCVRWLSESLI